MVFEEASSLLRQRDRVLARTRHAGDLDEPLLAQVAQVARPRIERAIVPVAEITTGDHSKRADRRERARFRATQRVLAIAFPHSLALGSAWQVEMPREDVAWIRVARPVVPVAFGRSPVVSGVAVTVSVERLTCIVSLSVDAWRIVLAVARVRCRSAPVVVSVVVTTDGAAVAAVTRRCEPLPVA
jgi:hypothetical protein